MSSTPNLSLPTLPANSLQPSVVLNDALQLIDALLHLAVEDRDLAAPPATVAADAGKRWIIGTGPTGAWAGKAGQIALCTGEDLWRFIEPKPGFRAWVIDEAVDCRYSAGAWSVV